MFQGKCNHDCNLITCNVIVIDYICAVIDPCLANTSFAVSLFMSKQVVRVGIQTN